MCTDLMENNNLFYHTHTIKQPDRSLIKGHLPLVIWFTGLSGSGKSTLANALEHQLVHRFRTHTYLLDGDNVRLGLNADLTFTEADRKENIRRVGEVAKLMFDAGLVVITAFISPFRADRESVRQLFSTGSFWEIYVSCPLDICMQRDPKNLYKKALEGKISQFTGIESIYEVPLSPELILESHLKSVEQCVNDIINQMRKLQVIE